ncbi:hypothetical protein IF1G_03892 [Cordyceps javanica]|uniref:Secreted protein n=1 Tax=Cordyceps javanica TaxID=43265 RepID=A0A545V957_9HYPO|nr:hypothetical protein IF1G_03892 [Cordyceps javanica]
MLSWTLFRGDLPSLLSTACILKLLSPEGVVCGSAGAVTALRHPVSRLLGQPVSRTTLEDRGYSVSMKSLYIMSPS